MANKKIAMKGTRPEPQNGLKQFQETHGTFDPYAVSAVAKTDEYKTRAGKTGLTHIDDQNTKHAWPLGALSREADEGKVTFLKGNVPAKVGEPFTAIQVPEKMGRDAKGSMLI